MTKLEKMIDETTKQADEKLQQAQQLEQQLQQFQQIFQKTVNEHNSLIIRLNTLREIEAAGDGLKDDDTTPIEAINSKLVENQNP